MYTFSGIIVVGNYDDSSESRTSYQLSVGLWIIFGLAWLSTVIAMAQDFFQSLVDKVDDVMVQQMGVSKEIHINSTNLSLYFA